MNFFEKQEYSVNIFKKDQIYSKDLKRRFSDFDLFFNVHFLIPRRCFGNIEAICYRLSPKKISLLLLKLKFPIQKMRSISK